MKKIIEYIISLRAIFLLVILLTLPTVNAAIAANDSSLLDVNVYSADKIQKVKLLAQDITTEQFVIASSNCSRSLPPNCSFSTDDEARKALMKYRQAVEQCQNGSGTEEAVENAWRHVRSRCSDTMRGRLLEDFEFPENFENQ